MRWRPAVQQVVQPVDDLHPAPAHTLGRHFLNDLVSGDPQYRYSVSRRRPQMRRAQPCSAAEGAPLEMCSGHRSQRFKPAARLGPAGRRFSSILPLPTMFDVEEISALDAALRWSDAF